MEQEIQHENPVLSRDELLSHYQAGRRDFHEVNLEGQDLSHCQLSEINLSDAHLSDVNLSGADLRNSNLSRADMTRAKLSRSDLSESDLSRAKLVDAELVGADLRRIKGRAANFSNALMLRVKMNDADCLGATMTGINATASQMESANFECADLTGAMLMNANLCGVNLSWANLSNARMNWSTMTWSLLEAADLENANLTGVGLRAANLSFANLDGVILTGADLYLANLSGALLPKDNLPAARLFSSRLTSQTYSRSQWSRQLLRDWQLKGAILLDFESFPRDIQQFICEGECNLMIYFTIPIENDLRVALEALVYHVTHHNESCQILSIRNEKNQSSVAFYSKDPSYVELIASALRTRSWCDDAEQINADFQEYQTKFHTLDFDVFEKLDELSRHLRHIQGFIPTSKEDSFSRLQAQYKLGENCERKTEISWSSISLPKVSR